MVLWAMAAALLLAALCSVAQGQLLWMHMPVQPCSAWVAGCRTHACCTVSAWAHFQAAAEQHHPPAPAQDWTLLQALQLGQVGSWHLSAAAICHLRLSHCCRLAAYTPVAPQCCSWGSSYRQQAHLLVTCSCHHRSPLRMCHMRSWSMAAAA